MQSYATFFKRMQSYAKDAKDAKLCKVMQKDAKQLKLL